MSKTVEQVSVLGAGSWGTAIASVLSQKGVKTYLWGNDPQHIKNLQRDRENKKYLPGYYFSKNILPQSDFTNTISDSQVICMVVPSHGFRTVFRKVVPLLGKGTIIVSAVKGIENNSCMTMSQVMQEELDSSGVNDISIGVLSGPSFAREVVDGIPTAVTIGCKNLDVAKRLQRLFVTDLFRVYAAKDVVGLEISAALKNIVAIGAGICDGLGYGLNTRAALITRGLAEIKRLGVMMGGEEGTFSGLSGLGDLVLTCTGDLSRNRSVGFQLGQGKKLNTIMEEMEMVAEGVKTTKSVHDLVATMDVEMPILEQVYQILYNDKDCSIAVKDLLTRELKVEE